MIINPRLQEEPRGEVLISVPPGNAKVIGVGWLLAVGEKQGMEYTSCQNVLERVTRLGHNLGQKK